MQEQAIPTPFGISVFGSSIVRAEPDFAALRFAVNRLEQAPKDAFAAAKEGARRVRLVLTDARLDDIASSRVSLTQTFRIVGGERRMEGYTARVAFSAILRELDGLEKVLTGVIEAGVDEVTAVELGTTRLKQLRAEARQEAVAAAREKAENYAEAAGVKLGKVVHLEDVNPDRLRGREGHFTGAATHDASGSGLEPGIIAVGGAVVVGFAIKR